MTESDLLEQLVKSFIDLHSAQLKTSGVPEHYWPTLFHKIKNEVFDAGEYFQVVMRVDEDDELLGYKAVYAKDSELTLEDANGIFLIDHAWTYRVNEARQNLREHDSLLDRMCNLMCVNQEEGAAGVEEKIEQVIERMWKFNQTYKLSTEKMSDDEREPIWYIMDEFGSSVRHSDEPNVKCVPFFYVPTNTMFSILFPNKSLKQGEEIKRDYLYGIKDETLRKAKLVPWTDYEEDEENSLDAQPTVQEEPGVEYFLSGRKDETLPSEETQNESEIIHLSSLKVIKVFTDLQSVRESLTDPKYVLVDDMSQADVVFIRKHFKQYKELQESRPSCLVNQFPFENVVTVKDLLAIVSRRVKESQSWLPITYNLSYEMPKFIEYFRQREREELDNMWILKPWNLARSIDTTVTGNLNQIIRSQETGPKIACKYITNPVLFHRPELNGSVKFDIRYIVLLRSVKPLVIYTYKVFWLRFANKPFSLDNFDDYEKHFTVMNYKPSVVLKQIHYDEFIPQFESQNPGEKWHDGVERKIFAMIRQVFEGASAEKPPKGIGHNIQSRAMYAVDLMLDWRQNDKGKTIEPMICEVNFMPDCSRACQYHPNFFNDVFNTLFVDSLSNVTAI